MVLPSPTKSDDGGEVDNVGRFRPCQPCVGTQGGGSRAASADALATAATPRT